MTTDEMITHLLTDGNDIEKEIAARLDALWACLKLCRSWIGRDLTLYDKYNAPESMVNAMRYRLRVIDETLNTETPK